MKNHLKRIATPRTWVIDRLSRTFITRPKPGAHSLAQGMPLSVILRDMVKVASTTAEVKKILNNKEVLVDGKRRKDHRLIVGLFDIISIPELKQQFRIVLSSKGKLTAVTIPAEEAKTKVCRVEGKTKVAKGKIQLRLHDGRTLLYDKDVNVGDSIVLQLPEAKVSEVIGLAKGVFVHLTGGKYAGGNGTLKEIKGTEAIFTRDKQDIETAKKYLFVLGKKESTITIRQR